MKVGDLVCHQDWKDQLGVIVNVDTEPFEGVDRHFIQVRWLEDSRVRWEISIELESAA